MAQPKKQTENQDPKVPQRQRARNKAGTYKGGSPELNDAWVPTEVETGLEKKIDYTIKTKVEGPSNPTAGKYGKRTPVRPTFGKVITIEH